MTDGPIAVEASSRSLAGKLPREIIREILRFFSNDKWLLKNYALVSQNWLFESRPFLFQNIDIFSRDPSDRFISNVLHSERLRTWLTSIHHLAFKGREDFILDISERLSNLRTMEWGAFWALKKGYRLRPEVFPALGKFVRLRHLELEQCVFPSFADFKQVIVAFPSLTLLTLVLVSWSNPPGPDDSSSVLAPLQTRPTLLKLVIWDLQFYGSRCVENVILWLSTTPTRHQLKEFTFDLSSLTAALRLMAGTSFTLDVQMERTGILLGHIYLNLLRSPRSSHLHH